MKKYFFILLISVLCISCHNGVQESAQDTDTIDVHLAILPTADCEPFVRARDMGIYDSLGIKVDITTFNAAMDIDTAVLKHHVNVFFTDTVRLARLYEKDNSIKKAEEWPAHYMLLTMDTTVVYLKSLKEKTVAMTRHSAEHRLFDRLLTTAHYEEGDVFAIQINDVNLRRQMLEQNLVTAALLPHPQADTALAHGAHRILFADSTERFAIAYRLTKKLTKEKLELFIQAYKTATSTTR